MISTFDISKIFPKDIIEKIRKIIFNYYSIELYYTSNNDSMHTMIKIVADNSRGFETYSKLYVEGCNYGFTQIPDDIIDIYNKINEVWSSVTKETLEECWRKF